MPSRPEIIASSTRVAGISLCLGLSSLIFFSPAVSAKQKNSAARYPDQFYVDKNFDRRTMNTVDKYISKELFDEKLAKTVWKEALHQDEDKILSSANLKELSLSMNDAIAHLKLSHCNFVTVNDEMYGFLHSMFSDFSKKLGRGKVDFVGFHAGGNGFADNQVRYVLDGSPADKAGMKIGDIVRKVNGKPYIGEMNFFGTTGSTAQVDIERKGEQRTLSMKPIKADVYDAYLKAMKESISVQTLNGKKIGYIHLWCGGRRSHEAFEDLLSSEKLDGTDGLILDMRDGYGGNDMSDLDRFYRSEKAYPIFSVSYRGGKKQVFKEFYDKPVVAIINGGSRSGKELLAYSLKRTGRARLVGTKTAGAVLGGRLMPINDRSSLYVAVFDGTVSGERLEGKGVAPDVEIDNSDHDQQGYDRQTQAARDELSKMLSQNSSLSQSSAVQAR